MKFIYLMPCLILVASATPHAIVGINEDESKEIDTIDSSESVEYPSDDLSTENVSKLQRRSIGLLLGTWPNLNPLKSVLPHRHFSGQPNRYHRHHNRLRNHNHFRQHPFHNHPRHLHHNHQHHRHNSHWQFRNHHPCVTTTLRPTPIFTTIRTTNSRLTQTTPRLTTRLITTTVPTTRTTQRLTTTTVPTTSTTSTTTKLITTTVLPTSKGRPLPTSTTTTAASSDLLTDSPTTPRYNDPDNELIYDIDLRFGV